MVGKQTTEIQIYFNVSLLDYVRNMFKAKAKRQRRDVTFTGFDSFRFTAAGLTVRWGEVLYFYPMHKLGRVKFI